MFQLNASNVFGLAITYLAFRTVYHLYLSPLAKFPGPKLAAISRLYELYHDGYRSGGYICRCGLLHICGHMGSCIVRGHHLQLSLGVLSVTICVMLLCWADVPVILPTKLTPPTDCVNLGLSGWEGSGLAAAQALTQPEDLDKCQQVYQYGYGLMVV